MAQNFLAALLQTVAQTSLAGAEAYAQSGGSGSGSGKKKKKGPGCTPCAVNARVVEAKARAGFG